MEKSIAKSNPAFIKATNQVKETKHFEGKPVINSSLRKLVIEARQHK
ncbi:hypothetical protein [Sphaerochaeta halotolerans]|nr:hypothetical protein [Sphaerochaeta halotolerans]